MPIRPKTVRRLLALAVAGASLSAAVGVTFVHRRHVADAQVAASRASGLAAFAAGDQARAIADLQRYLAARPSDVDALMTLGRARMLHTPTPGRDDLFEARARFQQLLAIAPGRVEARLALLDVYDRLGYAAEQLTLADRTLEFAPNQADALRHRAVALSRLDRRPEAVAAWRQVVAARPDDVASRVRLVAALRRAQADPEKIVAEARALADARPAQPEFAMPLADALHGAGRDDEAAALLRKAAAAPPADPALIVELVDSLDRCRDFAEADRTLARAAGAIDSSLIRDAFVERLWQAGRFNEVLAATDKQVAMPESASPRVVAMRALSLRALGRDAESRRLVADLAATRRDPRSAAWSDALAVEFAELPLTPGARVKALRDSLSRDPSNGVVYAWLARSLRAIGEADQAAAAYREAAGRMPRWAAPCVELASLMLDAGQLNDAIAAAKAAWSREPESPASLSIVARVRFAAVESRRDVDEERVLLSLVNSLRAAWPRDASLLPVQIGLLARAGDAAGAVGTIDAALAAKPDEPTLLALYRADRRYALGLGAAIFDVAASASLITPALATLRAADLIDARDAAAGVALIDGELARHPRAAAWSIAAARTYQRAADPRAAEAWRALVDSYPDDLAAQAAALDEASATVDADRAIAARALDRLRAAMGDTAVEYRLRRARFLLRSPRPEEQRQALAMATDLAREVPDRAEVRALLAGQLLASGSHAIALEHLRAAYEQSPSNVAIGIAFADTQRRLGRQPDADATLRRLAQYDFADASDRSRVGEALLDAGLGDVAVAMLSRARDVHVLDPAGTATLAETLASRGDAERAQQLFNELTRPDARPSPTTLAAAAADARRRGDAEAAGALLARIDSAGSSVGERERARARYAARFCEVEAARAHFAAAVAEATSDAATAREAIAFECSAGNMTRAADLAGTAAARFPRDRSIAVAREELEARRGAAGDPSELARLVELISRDPSRRAESDVLSALDDARRTGRATPELAERFARLSALYPASINVARSAVESSLAANRPARAGEIADRWASADGADGAELAARTYARVGRWSEAAAVAARWRGIADVDPIEPDSILAAASIERGDVGAAMARLSPHVASLDLDTHPSAVATYARGLVLTRRADEAFGLLKARLPTSSAARSIWLTLLGDADETAAVDRAGELLAAMPADATAERVRLAVACASLADRAGSTVAADCGLEALGKSTDDESPRVTLVRGDLLRASGRPADAERILRALLAARPNDPMAQNALAYLLVEQGQPKGMPEAVRLAQAAATAAPDQAAVLDTLARAEWATGEMTAAEARFRAAAAIDSRLSDPRVGLATLLGDNGRPVEAARLVSDLKQSVDTGKMVVPARLRPSYAVLIERFPAAATSAANHR